MLRAVARNKSRALAQPKSAFEDSVTARKRGSCRGVSGKYVAIRPDGRDDADTNGHYERQHDRVLDRRWPVFLADEINGGPGQLAHGSPSR